MDWFPQHSKSIFKGNKVIYHNISTATNKSNQYTVNTEKESFKLGEGWYTKLKPVKQQKYVYKKLDI